jgi:hypothetical protein
VIRFSRQRVLLFVAALLLVGAAIAQVIAERNPSGPPLSSSDGNPSGALALARWLEALGYQVGRMEDPSSFESTQILFVLEPMRRFERAEAEAILDWVKRGGVLVYVPSLVPFSTLSATPNTGDGLSDALDLGVRYGPYVSEATPAIPFVSEPQASRFDVRTGRALELRDDAWVPLLQGGDHVVAATRQLGNGRVYVTTSDALFANDGIATADNRAFVLNVLAHHPDRRAATFEEYHHTIIERPDLANTIRTTPWGWAVSYFVLLSFLFMLWAGRRFGPPVVAERAVARSSGEYIVSFAGLLQKARASSWVQQQYAGLVRRRLARMLGVRADLPSADLARLLAERRPIDPAALAGHLAALDGPPLSQGALLSEVRAIEQLLIRGSKAGGQGSAETPAPSGP